MLYDITISASKNLTETEVTIDRVMELCKKNKQLTCSIADEKQEIFYGKCGDFLSIYNELNSLIGTL